MQYFFQYFVILKRLVSEIMKLLSLEIEKKIIATSQIIQHQKLLKLFTSQNNNDKSKQKINIKKVKIILLQLLRLLHYFFHKSIA